MQVKFTALLLFAAAVQAFGGNRHKLLPPRVQAVGSASASASILADKQAASANKAGGGCSDGTITVTAPKTNIFGGLSDDEFANVTSFLHQQKRLNLTAVSNATAYVWH